MLFLLKKETYDIRVEHSLADYIKGRDQVLVKAFAILKEKALAADL